MYHFYPNIINKAFVLLKAKAKFVRAAKFVLTSCWKRYSEAGNVPFPSILQTLSVSHSLLHTLRFLLINFINANLSGVSKHILRNNECHTHVFTVTPFPKRGRQSLKITNGDFETTFIIDQPTLSGPSSLSNLIRHAWSYFYDADQKRKGKKSRTLHFIK